MKLLFVLAAVFLSCTTPQVSYAIESQAPAFPAPVAYDDVCQTQQGITDNLSCPRNDGVLQCYSRSQLCDGIADCSDGSDEGISLNALDCDGLFTGRVNGTIPAFVCGAGIVVELDQLCDGIKDCGCGDDESTALCENKCLFPYYGGCPYSRKCVFTDLDLNCGLCRPGWARNPAAPLGECLEAFFEFSLTTFSVVENAGLLSGSITLSTAGQINQGILVVVQTVSNSGSATASVDYTPVVTTVTFPRFAGGGNTQDFTVPIIDELLVEGTETFILSATIVNDLGNFTAGGDTATGVIIDNDRDCTANTGLGSRLCTNTETLSVDCIPPAQVCDLNTADCPDMSDEFNCPSPLQKVVLEMISEETYTNVSGVISSFTTLSESRMFLQTMQFLNDVSTVFNSIANFTDTTIVPINEMVVRNLGQTLNSLVQWQPSNLEVDTTSRIVESFEEVATRFAQQSNLTVELTDITFIFEQGTTETFMREGRTEDFTRRAEVPASISLPPELFNQVLADRPLIGVYLALYDNAALFPTNLSAVVRDNVTRSVGTPIVGATVGLAGVDFSGNVPLDTPVVITLGLLPLPENTSANPSTARCVSWDFVSDSWITDGCTTEVVNETTFRCSCTHLTNFAVLVDICQRAQDCVNDPTAVNDPTTVDQVLSFISYIGIALSCIGMVVTIITMIIFKKLRERDNSKYHIQLSIAILCMLVVFAVGIERIEVYGGCVFVSILIHYFSLVSVMWMGAEALLMFQKLVLVFMSITTKFIVILSLVCWLFPLIPVLIPMIIDLADGTTPETDLIITRNVEPITGDVTGGFCFLKHPGVFFGAFLAPIFAVLLFNMVIFIWVIVILLKHTRGNMKRSNQKMSFKAALRLLVSISGVMFLFGLTWLFAALTININGSNAVRTIFQVLFTVFASFQGFLVFLFFVIFNPEARESWREFLSCGRYKSKLLHPSQYKNNANSTGTGTRTPKANTGTIATSSSVGNAYIHSNYNTVNLNSGASPLPEKIDLSKNDDEKQTDTPLTSTSQV